MHPRRFQSVKMSQQEGSLVPHVCVVGAGIAGLRCATILVSYGLKVTILEARERIGGRVGKREDVPHLLSDLLSMIDLAEQ